jgi:trehalose/maltose hydrolase-like predicted phosphorylase
MKIDRARASRLGWKGAAYSFRSASVEQMSITRRLQ